MAPFSYDRAGGLHLPHLTDQSIHSYKDWLHLNIFDESTESIGIFNVSLHGSPIEQSSRAIGTALLFSHKNSWRGNIEVRGIHQSIVEPNFVGLPKIGLAISLNPTTVLVSVVEMDGITSAQIKATAISTPLIFELPMQFGSGWIAWSVVPLLRIEGTVEIQGISRTLSNVWAYHDHNWGRWHWGDDIGWEWGCFTAIDGKACIVFAQTTDRSHRERGHAWLSFHTPDGQFQFMPNSITCKYESQETILAKRYPGALAALHQDRAHVNLPRIIRIQGNDGSNHLEIEFTALSAAQLITADPHIQGYGFIHELPGRFQVTGKIRSQTINYTGMGIVEYVC